MPNYRFVCDTCGVELFVIYLVEDAPLERVCEKCAGRMVKSLPTQIMVNGGRYLDFVMENAAGEPERISTKRQMDRVCEERGIVPMTRDDMRGWKKARDMKPSLPSFEESFKEVVKQTGQGWETKRGKRKRPKCAGV